MLPKPRSSVAGGLFKKVTEEVMRKEIDNIGKGGDYESYIKQEFETYKIKDNVNSFIRILPPHVNNPTNDFIKRVFVHEYFGGDGGYLCLAKLDKMLGVPSKRCPLCEKCVEAQMIGNMDLAKKLRTKEKYVMMVLDTSNEPQSMNVMVLISPQRLRDMIVRLIEHPRGGIVPLVDAEEGQEVIFMRAKNKGEIYSTYVSAQLGNVWPIVPGAADYDIVAQQLTPFNDVLLVPTEEDLDEVARYIVVKPIEATEPQTTTVTGRRGVPGSQPVAHPVVSKEECPLPASTISRRLIKPLVRG